MLWNNGQIDSAIVDIGVPLSVDLHVQGAMRTMRDDYEVRLAELEETISALREIEVERGNAFREVMLLSESYAARIAELKAEKKAKEHYIERLESMLTPEQLFDAAN